MSLASRYLFDTSFDAPRTGHSQAISAAELEAEQQRRRQQEADQRLAAIRADAFAQGREQGRAEGLAEAEHGYSRDMLSLIEHVADSLILLGQQEAENRQRADTAAVACASAILGRIVPALVAREGLGEIEGLLRECLMQARDEPRMVLRVPPALFDSAKTEIDRIQEETAFSGRIVLIADATLGRNGARLEWADGGAERDPERLWAEIDGAIQRVLSVPSQFTRAARSATHDDTANLEMTSPGAPVV